MDLILSQAQNDEHLVQLWLSTKRSRKTQILYKAEAEFFLNFVGKSIKQVTLDDMVAYIAVLEKKYTNINTLRTKMASVKSLFTFAHKLGYINFNVPTVLTMPPQQPARIPRELDEDVIVDLIMSIKKKRDHVLLRVLYSTGIRINSLVKLRKEDISITKRKDLETGETHEHVILHITEDKRERSRYVTLSKPTSDALLDYIDNQVKVKETWVFPSKKTKTGHLSENGVRDIIRRYFENIGIYHVSPHWFRHAHISHALDHLAPIHLVQTTVDHKSLDTTSKYAHSKKTESSSLYLKI